MDDSVYEILQNYNWPGNVRELKNISEQLSILCYDCKITGDRLPQELLLSKVNIENILTDQNKSLNVVLEEVEKTLIQKALLKAGNNKAKAAELLGLPPSTLKSKIEKYRIV